MRLEKGTVLEYLPPFVPVAPDENAKIENIIAATQGHPDKDKIQVTVDRVVRNAQDQLVEVDVITPNGETITLSGWELKQLSTPRQRV